MKIEKLDTGNVLILREDDTITASLSPLTNIRVDSGVGSMIHIGDSKNGGLTITAEKVSALIKADIETEFNGDTNDLLEELTTNFFFDKTQSV